MGILNIKEIFGGEGEDNEVNEVVDDQFYSKSKEQYHAENGVAGSKMMLLEPRAYSESQQIADYLKNRNAVVVNLKRVTPDQSKRIVDFISGTIYAIGGDIQKLGGGIFLCTPNNVQVDGSISEDNNNNKESRKTNSKKDSNDDDYFN